MFGDQLESRTCSVSLVNELGSRACYMGTSKKVGHVICPL
jgi:hypothetical protein